MLSILWDYKDVEHFWLLPANQTTNETGGSNKEKNGKKLSKLTNCKWTVFQYDNAKLYMHLITRDELFAFGLKVMLYSPYRPDLATSNYHLFPKFTKILWMIKLSQIMMTWYRNSFSFWLTRSRSYISTEPWSCQKYGKRSSNKMESI